MRSYPKVACAKLLCLLVSLFFTGSAQTQSPDAKQAKSKPGVEKWQTSWPTFVKELVTEAGGVPGEKSPPRVVERFGKKQVTWEGTIDSQFSADGSANVLEMPSDPETPTMEVQVRGVTMKAVILLHLKPAASQVQAWTKLSPGTKVRFRATLDELVYLTMGPTVNVMAGDAKLIQ